MRCKTLKSKDTARIAVEAASDKQATDVVMLDVKKICGFADYFVLCSGESDRQLNAIIDSVEDTLASKGVKARSREGAPDSGWVLIDYGDVVVHVFSPEKRGFYDLEDLWAKAVPVVRLA